MAALNFPDPNVTTTYNPGFGTSYTWNATYGAWVADAPSGGGGGTAATLAEAAAGTLNTVFSSPETAVPKDAAGMTGAAIIPGGTTAEQPASAVAGMVRFNSDNGVMEFYDGTAWSTIGGGGGSVLLYQYGGFGTTTLFTHGLGLSSATVNAAFSGFITNGQGKFWCWAGSAHATGALQNNATPSVSTNTVVLGNNGTSTINSASLGAHWAYTV